MATWTTLTADADLMRAGNESFLTQSSNEYSDSELLLLNKTGAKVIMKNDVCQATHIDQEDTTTIDDIVDLDDHDQKTLKIALSYLQLKLFYSNMAFGNEGTVAYSKYKEYSKLYEQMKNTFQFLMVRKMDLQYNTTGNFTVG